MKNLMDQVKFLQLFLGAEKSDNIFSVGPGAKRSDAASASDLGADSNKKPCASEPTAMEVDDSEQYKLQS